MAKHMQDISSNSGSKGKKAVLVAVIVIAVLALAAAGIFLISDARKKAAEQARIRAILDRNTFYSGVVVQGVDLGGKTMEEAQTAVKALEPSLRETYDITVTYGDKSWKITQDDFAFTFDTDSVLKDAYNCGRTGSDEERLQEIESLKTTPKTFEIASTMSYDNLDSKLKTMTDGLDSDPVDATVSSFDAGSGTFAFTKEKDGVKINQSKLRTDVEAVINGSRTGTVKMTADKVACKVTAAELKKYMKRLGTFQTVSTNTEDGNHNMQLAMQAVNGKVIKAGGTFSFNSSTGDTTTAANGYRKAVAIVNGKKEQQYGGGICQVSTTIYGAALRSNMTITERHNHLWPSSYAPLGLDATVDYPYLDFKFTNPTAYPVYLVAGMVGKKLTVTLYGYQSPDYDSIEASSWQTGTLPQPEDKYVVDNTMKQGEIVLDIKGNAGRTASAQRTYYKNGKEVKTEQLPSSTYRAVANTYKMGPGTDPKTALASSSSSESGASSSQPTSSASSSSAAPASSAAASSSESASVTSQTTSSDGAVAAG